MEKLDILMIKDLEEQLRKEAQTMTDKIKELIIYEGNDAEIEELKKAKKRNLDAAELLNQARWMFEHQEGKWQQMKI